MARRSSSSRVRRGLLTVVVGAVAATGVGLWVGGARAARNATDTAGAELVTSTSTTTTAPTTTTTAPTTTTTTTAAPIEPVDDGTLEHGEEGDAILALQARLAGLGYWHGPSDGTYGQLTRQAVMAFQKAEGLGRDGKAGPATLMALATAARPAPRDPAGDHLEIDLARQILLVVQGGQTTWVLNTSTGSGEAYASARRHRGGRHARGPVCDRP